VNRWLVLGVALVLAAAVGAAISDGGGGGSNSPSGVSKGAAAAVPAAPRLDFPNARLHPGRIVGFVRDVNGTPVAGARVRLSSGRASVRAGRSGRFTLRARPGRHTVVASHRWYTSQAVAATLERGRGTRVDFSLAVTAPARVAVPNSADRMIVWTGCDKLAGLGESDLRRWIARGADGFVCQTNRLWGLGGNQRFAGHPRARPAGAEYRLERGLSASPAVRLAREGKLVLYLGFKAVNYYNTSTPFADWFDDRGWSRKVLPAVGDLAAAARSMGFAGLAIDQELYTQTGGAQTASWSVHYPGVRHSEAEVRAKVAHRGRQLMHAMVAAYPGLELVAYGTRFPESWDALVQATANHVQNAFADEVQVDLWNGLSSVQGYSAIRWLDALFYKGFQLGAATWDTALQYNADRLYSYFSRRFSNWSYASSRAHISPFSWIGPGPKPSQDARDPAFVADQLDAFRRWGAGGAFGNYVYGPLGGFDYSPYENAMRQASTPARVDQQPPDLAITSPKRSTRRLRSGTTIALSGVANDAFAIRAVRWSDDRGRQGVARLVWRYTGDMTSGWKGLMRWSIARLPVNRDAGHITISAEDIHGLARQLRLTVVHGG
jgi:hypothetical protein